MRTIVAEPIPLFPEVVPGGDKGEWGDAEGQEMWGRDLTVSNLSESDTLVDTDVAKAMFLKMYGTEDKWFLEEPVVVPPPRDNHWENIDRPQSCGPIMAEGWEVPCDGDMRRVASSL